MKILTYGEIMEGGSSVFHSVAKLDEQQLSLCFQGAIRIDNPYRALESHLQELCQALEAYGQQVQKVLLDFSELRFCNSNGFYVIMDMVEAVYQRLTAPVIVRRIQDDDWQQETLPILLNIDEQSVAERTHFENVREL